MNIYPADEVASFHVLDLDDLNVWEIWRETQAYGFSFPVSGDAITIGEDYLRRNP